MRFLDEDAAPDLVAKADVITEGQPVVGDVPAFLLGRLHVDGELVLTLGEHNSLENNWVAAQVITAGLDENNVLRPGRNSVVAKGPSLEEQGTWSNFVKIRNALLDEASRILDLLLFLGLAGISTHLLLVDLFHTWLDEVSIVLGSSVLADKLRWSVGSLTDLQKWVVGVDAGLLAVLAKVVVGAD